MNRPESERPEHDEFDAELRRAFAPPPEQQFAAAARSATTPATTPRRLPIPPPSVWLAAAALLALLAWHFASGGARPTGPEGHDGPELGRMWAAAYEDAIDRGFGAGGCCDGTGEFATICRQVCGRTLRFRDEDGDASLLGCYRGLPVGCSLCVLVQVDGEPTAVFVLPRDQDPHPTLADRDDLTLQRRTLDDLVLYAVSTEARGDALQRFAP